MGYDPRRTSLHFAALLSARILRDNRRALYLIATARWLFATCLDEMWRGDARIPKSPANERNRW